MMESHPALLQSNMNSGPSSHQPGCCQVLPIYIDMAVNISSKVAILKSIISEQVVAGGVVGLLSVLYSIYLSTLASPLYWLLVVADDSVQSPIGSL